MLRRTLIASALAAAAAGTLALGVAIAQPAPAPVGIEHHMFGPDEVRIHAGQAVEWTNHDLAPHTVTSDDGGFKSSGWLVKGTHHNVTFDKPGRYHYHCSIHKEMHGVVIVD